LNTLERKYSIESGCFFVKFKSDNKLLYESDDGLSLYDSEKDEEISRYVGHYCTVNHACFLNDDKLIMSAGSEGTLRLYDTSTSKNLYTFFSHQAQGFNYIDVHPNEKMIIAADDSKTLYILSPED
jgi:WD40 repeat protein